MTAQTLGVEEEFHLVDPATGALAASSTVADAAVLGQAGPHVQPEISTTQLETATGVCTTLAEVRAALQETRGEAVKAAQSDGLTVLAASTHPSSAVGDLVLTDAPRYRVMVERWAGLATGQDICGTHVHVGVDDLDTAVHVMDRARPWLPLLLAMTGSSPFHQAADTGYESWRTVWWSRWPVSGPPDQLGDAAGYRDVVRQLVASGMVPDGSQLYWDLRPSTHVPTVEFRGADVCTDLDDVVLHAALCRSLVAVLARDTAPAPQIRPEVLRAARWKAARAGLTGELFDPATTELVPAGTAVRSLLTVVRDDLDERGDLDEVTALTEQLLARGTSAARQRRTMHRTGDAGAVVRDLLEVGGTAV
ncbi:carboxylate-amine ligase [Klenkia marina]|uniref:Putative glutamate--cysteine ligase 2 n=1 Tax=Klenkia marina TaxID=1960309 RepID=A0A1G4YTU6_9ACTN|nr:glutamate--cysteine ligase [Klenkia marina]SCX56775.1 carboxylate-amine ligase [Klenkia marina]